MYRRVSSPFCSVPRALFASSLFVQAIFGLIYATALAIYLISLYAEPYHAVTYSALGYVLFSIVQYYYYTWHGGYMVELVNQLSHSLDKNVVARLRATCNKLNWIPLTLAGLVILGKIVTTFLYNVTEFWSLLSAFPETQYDYIFDTALVVTIILYTVVFNVYLQFYAQVNSVLDQHCQLMISLCDEAMKKRALLDKYFYSRMEKLYTEHLNVKVTMNETMSLTPFCVIVALFVNDLGTLAYFIASTTSWPPMFLYLGILPATLNHHLTAIYVCLAAGGATERLQDAAKRIISVASHCPLLESEEDKRTRKNLRRVVVSQEPEPACVYTLFTVDSQLILSFTAQVVPFTVMIVSAIAQFSGETSPLFQQ
ncbi:hypothetical protein HDE_09522 [Halotydeus destructor]|nr:hypothetical protein HDE_09522 [Halotydeus destructor]